MQQGTGNDLQIVNIGAEESQVIGTASFTSSAMDALGANDTSTVDYLVGKADRLFSDGFES